MIETTPTFDLTTDDIESFLAELEQYRAIYYDLFRRREQREQYDDYLQGLLLDIPNKSVETMILHMHDDDLNAIRRTQHFVSEGAWQDQAILERHWQEVSHDLGTDDGVLIVDDSGFPKQGQESVGVKRQWCGQLGKKANCQVGVFTAYASEYGYTLLDRRLYLPRDWVEDDAFTERREKSGVPAEITFKTKPQLALEMIETIRAADTLPFRWMVCDTRVWRERPATHVPTWSGRGRKPTQEQLLPDEPDAQQVRDVVATISPDDWSRHTIKEGAKGPIRADFVCLRVVAVRDSLPGPDVWLVIRRDIASGELKYYLSNAPEDVLLTTFVWLSGMRWPIEIVFPQVTKTDVSAGFSGWDDVSNLNLLVGHNHTVDE